MGYSYKLENKAIRKTKDRMQQTIDEHGKKGFNRWKKIPTLAVTLVLVRNRTKSLGQWGRAYILYETFYSSTLLTKKSFVRNHPFYTITLLLPIIILSLLAPIGLILPGYFYKKNKNKLKKMSDIF